MNACIIACRTLEKELLAATAKTGCTYPICWLEAGGHNLPEQRRFEIQAVLDACTGFDTVLLAMSQCGNLVAGLQSRDFQLVIPRCDDCITLLLGSRQERLSHPATYFLTEGWLAGRDHLLAEYQRTLEKYGSERTLKIFSAMLANYNQLAFVDTGCGDSSEQIQFVADVLQLRFARIAGNLTWLEELLQAPWPEKRFLVLPPHTILSLDTCLQTP